MFEGLNFHPLNYLFIFPDRRNHPQPLKNLSEWYIPTTPLIHIQRQGGAPPTPITLITVIILLF